jgi:lipopolysaccharide transport system permease protein
VGFIVPFTAGLTVYLYFSDLLISSLGLYVSKRNLVLKSPLPLWLLWLANLLRASAIAGINLLLFIILALFYGVLTASGLVAGIVVALVVVAALAPVSLLLSLIGPFAGDLSNALPVILRVMFYTAPITYPLSLIPIALRPYVWLNPLTSFTELLRETMVFGQSPSIVPLVIVVLASCALALSAIWCYRRVAPAIHDVV